MARNANYGELVRAACALCDATSDDDRVARILQTYWVIDAEQAGELVELARAAHRPARRPIARFLMDEVSAEDHSLDALTDYVENNVGEIKSGVRGGGIKFVTSSLLRWLARVCVTLFKVTLPWL